MAKWIVTAKATYDRPGKPKSRKPVETMVEAETREDALALAKSRWSVHSEARVSFSRLEAREQEAPRPPSPALLGRQRRK